jgi:hypothetical protein
LEILARPPGKKPQTMTLLSGGEQALTAMALIFAVFLTNPAPICVLDEVDAPLDDHNVERFCNLMDEMAASTETRFVIITHNPITMARMNRASPALVRRHHGRAGLNADTPPAGGCLRRSTCMFWVLFVLFDLLVLGWIWTRSLAAEAEKTVPPAGQRLPVSRFWSATRSAERCRLQWRSIAATGSARWLC